MEYRDLFSEKELVDIVDAQHLSLEYKYNLMKALDQKIDDRFAGFKHCITTTGRGHISNDPMEYKKYLDPFYIDQDKIKLSKAFRRIGEKAQVVTITEKNSHVRNRLIHTLELETLGEKFCYMLNQRFLEHKLPIRINKELVKAQTLAHDLGHTPFGHLGERFLKEEKKRNFSHNTFGIQIVERIERKGGGLNLTPETKSGIKNHSTNGGKLFLQGGKQEDAVTRIIDKIGYVGSDYNDSMSLGYIDEAYPMPIKKLGENQRQRDDVLLETLVNESFKHGYITFGDSGEEKILQDTRSLLFEKFYFPQDKERKEMCFQKLHTVYDFFERECPEVDPAICVALLTDKEVFLIEKMIKKNPHITYQDITRYKKSKTIGICEILPHIHGMKLD